MGTLYNVCYILYKLAANSIYFKLYTKFYLIITDQKLACAVSYFFKSFPETQDHCVLFHTN